MTRIMHLALLHGPDDTRIVQKECRTLAATGCDVHVVTGRASATSVPGITLPLLHLVPGHLRDPLEIVEAFCADRLLR